MKNIICSKVHISTISDFEIVPKCQAIDKTFFGKKEMNITSFVGIMRNTLRVTTRKK